MSVSGIGGSSVSGLFSEQMQQMNQRKRPEDFDSTEDFVDSILGDQDSDGDGLLSSSESNFKEDHFNKIDSDGDGYLSQEELVADVEKMQQMRAAMGNMSVSMGGGTGRNLIDSLMEELDSDSDGTISQEESGLKDELFSILDSDGDGSLSSSELEDNMKAMGPPPEGMGNMAASGSSAQSSSGSEESEEEYDEYDFNQDGVVTLDELQKAFASGDTSLEDIVGRRGDMNQQQSGEEGQSGQSILQRMAMRAYQDQSASSSAASLLGSSV
ncbi:EF-hand domain-containing protein [Desulfovibrio sp. JC010]|uniref:EF-hand domain-containing protein n=1 Tax=Desulfovibrio sp. JC010 TaxID=2593641 RepID=UPI0013CF99F6|nr:EF-hand domain-containing protein [Desulfovibrio sp. JC010]